MGVKKCLRQFPNVKTIFLKVGLWQNIHDDNNHDHDKMAKKQSSLSLTSRTSGRVQTNTPDEIQEMDKGKEWNYQKHQKAVEYQIKRWNVSPKNCIVFDKHPQHQMFRLRLARSMEVPRRYMLSMPNENYRHNSLLPVMSKLVKCSIYQRNHELGNIASTATDVICNFQHHSDSGFIP